MRSIFYGITDYIKRQPLNRLIMGSMLAIAFMLIIVIGYNWIAYENRKFQFESSNIKIQYEENQKRSIKREVERTINYIEYVRSLSQNKLMNNLSNTVETAWNIANNIYNENKSSRSDDEIKIMVRDALRFYRMNPEDYVFIYSLNGSAILDPGNPAIEGKSALSLHDSLGSFMVMRETELLKEVDRGFIEYYITSGKNKSDSSLYKLTYVKKFKPFGWYIGSKEYLADFEENIKSEVLRRLANIRFDNDGYIFIQSTNNDPVMAAGSIITKNSSTFTVGLKDRIKITEIALNGGGFVEYKYHRPGELDHEPKISYVQLSKEWDWIVGAGFYSNDTDQFVSVKRKELSEQRIKTFVRIFIALFLILVLGIFFTYQVNKRIKQGFTRFDRFFKDASEGHMEINETELYSPEFKSLAIAANKMISDLKQARNQLEKEHSLLRSVINSMPDMVFLKDIHSRYIGCNDAFLKYLQLKEEDFLGKTDFELFDKDSAEFYYKNDLQILKNGIPIRNEEWITMPDGNKYLYDTVKVLCHHKNGEIIGILCISRDITERDLIQKKYIEAKEKAEESDRLKTAFLANMSHEIRTPMNSIVGFSNLIAEGDLTREEQAEYVEHINTGINNLLNLINDIIDIAKIEAGQLNIKPEYYSIGKLIDDVYVSTSEYKKRFNRQGVTFNYVIEDRLRETRVLIDPYRLNQVLTNLIVNAIKFTLKGSIVFGCEKRDSGLYFYVSDTGIGITEKDQEVLFRRFTQVGDNNGYKAGGTGLGLAISKHLIELMYGQIGVQSHKGKGSLFYFTIPFFPLLETGNITRLSGTNWKDKTILIVEKEDASFNYLKAVFSGTSANILRVTETKKIIEQLENTKVDLLYIDFCLDDETSIDNITKIKQESPEIPLIVQSNYPPEQINSQIAVDGVVVKPVQYHLLLQAITNVIDNKNEAPSPEPH
ncbi:MAG TPA: cache domain-containing protein [Lentimicrobium sp.]|nr:cache domain-containing protein [Lentimicrobium sp.]